MCSVAKLCVSALICGVICLTQFQPLSAADHGDMPGLATTFGRSDAQITDFFAFTRGDNLVLALCTDPAIPTTVTEYLYASDLTLDIYIDRHSKVRYDDPDDVEQFGGTIVRPEAVVSDCRLTITFDDDGTPRLKTTGIAQKYLRNAEFFAGLRDDPFIRTPRAGRNVASVVIELPLSAVAKRDETLLLWATTTVPSVNGPIGDHGGRALRSMFFAPTEINLLSPKQQFLQIGLVPDAVILNSGLPSGFPNGRVLTDDVIDLTVGTLPGENPANSENDVPFLDDFPYLAPPH
jgi:hypothetical protein